MFFAFVCWIAIGVVIGFIVNQFVPLHDDDPKIGLAMGAAGAALGGFIFGLFTREGVNVFNTWSLVFAVIGALVVLAGWHTIRGFNARA